jgi:hypothetical protein
MPQRPLKMTTARAEKLFSIDIVDAPPPLRVEAVDKPAQPPLAAIAPEPIPPTAPPPLQVEAAPEPPIEPVKPAPAPAEIEAAADQRRRIEAAAQAARKRGKGVPKRHLAALKPPVPPPVAPAPHDTRH